MARPKKETPQEPLEKQLWSAADKLRKNIDAAEYKHVVLGLIFLKYISDSFESLFVRLQEGKGEFEGADPEDRDEYTAKNVFFVPQPARWNWLRDNAKKPEIGVLVDAAMDAIEKENPALKGVLPKVYAKENLDPSSLGTLIDLVSGIALGDAKARSADVLGHVFEYFLGEFALAEGKKGGQFYTPRSIVELLVAMLEPFKGRVMDPCCGSGGMFVQSEKFVREHQGRIKDISIYGQESNQTTWRLAKMNLAIRGIESSQVKWNNEGSFLNDALKDVRADYILANPPFNDSDWSGDMLRKDARWQYGLPSPSNANYAWIQHFIFHLSPKGCAAFLLATNALASESNIDKEIRSKIIGEDLIECIVLLPGKLFFTTPAPVSIWIISKDKLNRKNETLFIDASRIYTDINRTHRKLSSENIQKIVSTYHSWKNNNNYHDIPGYCCSVTLNQIQQNDNSLYPGFYIGVSDENIQIDKNKINISINTEYSEISDSLKNLHNLADDNHRLLQNILSKNIDYESYLLKDVLSESTEILGTRKEPEILSCTENSGLVLQSERFSKRVATLDTSKYKIVKKTNIVYNPYLLWAGAIDQCLIVDEAITSPAYIVLRIKDNFNPFIIGYILKSKYMRKWYWNISVGTHERRRTAPVDRFLNLKINIPSLSIQKEISTFYDKIMEQYLESQRIEKTYLKNLSSLNTLFTGLQ